MDGFSILITFTGGLAVAMVFGYFAHRVKLSPIIGYLLAGVVVGPFTPGFVAVIAAAQYNKFQLRSSALERHTLRGQGFLDTQGRVSYTSSQKKEVLINAFNN